MIFFSEEEALLSNVLFRHNMGEMKSPSLKNIDNYQIQINQSPRKMARFNGFLTFQETYFCYCVLEEGRHKQLTRAKYITLHIHCDGFMSRMLVLPYGHFQGLRGGTFRCQIQHYSNLLRLIQKKSTQNIPSRVSGTMMKNERFTTDFFTTSKEKQVPFPLAEWIFPLLALVF